MSSARSRIEFLLDGPKFGGNVGSTGKDVVLWMRLVLLGVSLSQTCMVACHVCDPDFPADPERTDWV